MSQPLGRGSNEHWQYQNPHEDDEERFMPSGIEGHRLGSRGMASVEELQAIIIQANVKAGEALGALGAAKDQTLAAVSQAEEAKNNYGNALGAVIEARDMVAAAAGSSGAESLTAMLALLEGAINEDLTPGWPQYGTATSSLHAANGSNEVASGNVQAAMEHGETYISRLMG